MGRRYFGTDGVRGIVGEDLTPRLVERLGRAQLTKLKIYAGPDHPHTAQSPKPF